MAISYVDELDFNNPEIKFGLFVVAFIGLASLSYNLLRWGGFLLSTFVLPGTSVRLYLLLFNTNIANIHYLAHKICSQRHLRCHNWRF
jgi:hypothetical protein